MTRVYIDSFTGSLGELPKGRRSVTNALRLLAKDPRVSTFERGTPWLESLITKMKGQGLIVEDASERYPWHRFDLTDKGRAAL